ncbi:MAG: hypothetical protein CMH39_00550 [Micrococcales bacterium]|nr:hypothetical protein [Micrococcales bacterium]
MDTNKNMIAFPSPTAARDLLRDVLRKNINATMLECKLRVRPTWDGAGYDVAYEGHVLWAREDYEARVEYGSHYFTVRGNWDGRRATLDSGYYGGKTPEEGRCERYERDRGAVMYGTDDDRASLRDLKSKTNP